MTDLIHFIWYNQAIGQSKKIGREIYYKIGDILKIYNFTEQDFLNLGVSNPKLLESLCNKDLKNAEKELWYADNYAVSIITIADEKYPKRLKQISDHPLVLYVRGNYFDTDEMFCISVVGARRSSPLSSALTKKLCANLAKSGVVIVSGMAEGIDTCAHIGCLSAGGKTIAVLGNGVNKAYPKSNSDLMAEIAVDGFVISEYGFFEKTYPSNFLARNRIISSLSAGTLVVDAGEKSGSLITAKAAFAQGRDVFVFDLNNQPLGIEQLIKQDAKKINGAEDILDYYKGEYSIMVNENKVIINGDNELDAYESKIMELLETTSLSADDISRITNISVSKINSVLLLMEMEGKIIGKAPNIYSKNFI